MGQVGKANTPANLCAVSLISEAFEGSTMTQQALHEATGVPRSTIANMKSQPFVVSIELLIRFAVALGADPREWVDAVEDFMGGGGSVIAFPAPKQSEPPASVPYVRSTRTAAKKRNRRGADDPESST